MRKTVLAVFENGVFKPKDPVDLEDHTEVRLIVDVERPQKAAELLKAWTEGDESEQKDTWRYLKRVLDEDRPSSRKFFAS